MIPLKTVLQPRDPSDPIAEVGAVEGQRYTSKATEEFSATFALNADEIAAAYDCSGYTMAIEPFDEARAWFALSEQKFRKGNRASERRARAQLAEPSPEMVFRAEAEKNAKAAK